jgi:large subunit ribosomal protein L3
MRAAGRMGGERVTVHNLKVLRVDADNHLLIVEGGIPGAPSGYVIIRKAVALKKLKVAQVEKVKKAKK